MAEQLTNRLDYNMDRMKELLYLDSNFDIVYRVMDIGGRAACFYFVDGFTKDDILQKLMQFFLDKKPGDMPENAHELSKEMIPYGEVDLVGDFDKITKNLLSGVSILLIDGYEKAFAIDCRTYPSRGVEEPEKDKVMRGSRDGFVETLVFNTALIRRRIRSTKLTMEIYNVGTSSQTDIVISYMKDRVDKRVLEEVKRRIQGITIDSLTMNQESLAECLYRHKWYNPFPKFKFSERPDTTAASILEGNIVILVDNSPSAMILPTSVFDIIEDADDYYFPPVTGSYLRLSRFIINILAVLMTPTFLLFMMRTDWIPEWLNFIRIKDPINIPLIFQFLILEFAIDGLRLASLNTPSMLSTPLSVVAGIVLGDFTVSSGWFNSETMLYMAFVAIANYTQSSFELGYALKFMRIILLILTSIFHIYGYFIGIAFTIAVIISNKTISGRSYIYPLFPLDIKQLIRRFFRISLPRSED